MGKSRGKQRKQGDKWYHLAKEQGYRSRSSFKLIQLNKKYHFLEKTKVLIDLCAAPGGWLQVASKYCMAGSLICGIDLVPIKPIPNVETFVQDITTDKCREKLRQYLKTWKADTILHDGAPNVGVAWIHDAYSQAELVLASLKIVTEFLISNGTFITKIFRSKDYNSLLWVFNQLFKKVEATKPLASRDVSAEIFVVCQQYKAPDKIDPKFLDPKYVFEDLPCPAPDHVTRIFNPLKIKRQREGYEDGNYTQHKTVTAEEFLNSNNPIEILSIASAISLDDRDLENYKGIKDFDITTEEIIQCCKDLKVLGRKDFRGLLKWRILVREKLGLSEKKETNLQEKVEIVPLNEEEEIEQEMNKLNNQEIMRKKREKRRMLESKRKSILRLRLGMIEPFDIGLEQSETISEDPIFEIPFKELNKLEAENAEMDLISEDDIDATEPETEFEDSEDDLDKMEKELDLMYEHYRLKKKEFKSKINDNFNETNNDELNTIESDYKSEKHIDFDLKDENQSSTFESDSDSLEFIDSEEKGELTQKAKLFFDNDIFKIHNNYFEDLDNTKTVENKLLKTHKNQSKPSCKTHNDELDDNIKILHETTKKNQTNLIKGNKNKLDITTPEEMTLARSIASKEKSKEDIIDDSYNKWSFQDNKNLPEWFLDDERKHNKRNIPISKEAVMAIREKLKAMNARPIKKVLEAKARKKMKAMRRLKRIQEKAGSIIQTNDMSEKEKTESIKKLLKKSVKFKNRNKVKIVVAKGVNKGIKGRPKGVKGRYKFVDPRMKKELRAAKRIAKRRR
ncbi:ribosomal RNA large subunit methyltransferase J [Pneumocystis carinii B80]|uniref:Ribosomal RNA large subunit methyltransferase J n=1 Tax=Pneumocystis carinii (strain B80) TaxID=1408658 RepID=A0A0W4ZMR0_PNEC8|nr:ribosomal RNA large subunit methyltransferase J [Pneumocystis carinii B80]KTW29669.1 ribosomal RNA large subunit methyltransferase J [Pneumocystis carinii B80]